MRRISYMAIAAAVPLAAVAGEKDLASWDYESLQDDQRVSQILDAELYSAEGREIGDVRDVTFDQDARVASIIVESSEAAERAAPSDTEEVDYKGDHSMTDDPNTQDNTNYQATDDLPRASAIDDEDSNLAELDWQDVSFDAEREAITVETDVEFTESAATLDTSKAMDRTAIAEERGDSSMEDQTRPIENRGSDVAADTGEDEVAVADTTGAVRASEVIGMDVNLEDADSFGRVEDVLLSDDGKASAIVVDAWDLADKQRFALPADFSAIDSASGEIDLAYSEGEVSDLDEYEFDEFAL